MIIATAYDELMTKHFFMHFAVGLKKLDGSRSIETTCHLNVVARLLVISPKDHRAQWKLEMHEHKNRHALIHQALN